MASGRLSKGGGRLWEVAQRTRWPWGRGCLGREEGHGGGCLEEEMVQGQWLGGKVVAQQRFSKAGDVQGKVAQGRTSRRAGT